MVFLYFHIFLFTRLWVFYCAGAGVCAHIREGFLVYLAHSQSFGGARIGNPTPVRLYRLYYLRIQG